MGAAARELVEREHRLDRVADAYAAAIEELAGGPAVEEQVLREVARAAAEVGIGRRDDAAALAARLREVGLGDIGRPQSRGPRAARRARPLRPGLGLGRGARRRLDRRSATRSPAASSRRGSWSTS